MSLENLSIRVSTTSISLSLSSKGSVLAWGVKLDLTAARMGKLNYEIFQTAYFVRMKFRIWVSPQISTIRISCDFATQIMQIVPNIYFNNESFYLIPSFGKWIWFGIYVTNHTIRPANATREGSAVVIREKIKHDEENYANDSNNKTNSYRKCNIMTTEQFYLQPENI